jgi:hypothetical protein
LWLSHIHRCHQQRDLDRHRCRERLYIYIYILYKVRDRTEPCGTPPCVSLSLFITSRHGPQIKHSFSGVCGSLPSKAVVELLTSRSLPSNGSTCHSIFLRNIKQQHGHSTKCIFYRLATEILELAT